MYIHKCLFVFELIIFMMMRSINDVCYFILEMFVLMQNFDFYI